MRHDISDRNLNIDNTVRFEVQECGLLGAGKSEAVATWLRHKVREVTQSIARESVAD